MAIEWVTVRPSNVSFHSVELNVDPRSDITLFGMPKLLTISSCRNLRAGATPQDESERATTHFYFK